MGDHDLLFGNTFQGSAQARFFFFPLRVAQGFQLAPGQGNGMAGRVALGVIHLAIEAETDKGGLGAAVQSDTHLEMQPADRKTLIETMYGGRTVRRVFIPAVAQKLYNLQPLRAVRQQGLYQRVTFLARDAGFDLNSADAVMGKK